MVAPIIGLRADWIVHSTEDRYLIITRPNGAQGILCMTCGRASWHLEDVRQRYCGNCHVFHEDNLHGR
jgi:hypothetical protein